MVDTTEFNLVPNNEEEEFTVDFGEVTRLAGSSDFNQLQNRPQYDGQVMTGETDIPKVPTATSELNNDSDYQTGFEVQQTINAAIANKQDKLTAGQNITISEQNVISATGLTEVDWGDIGGNLNDQIDLKDVLDAKQDTLTPGDNVTIANNIISATDTKYTAGNGLSLNGTQFSADTAVLQEKLDAGNAITIENNTINADIYPADFFTNEATDTDTGSNITLNKTIPATLKSVELYGDTEQQAYSGKNLIPNAPAATLVAAGITWTITETTISGSGTISGSPSVFYQQQTFASDLPAGTYTFSIPASLNYAVKMDFRDVNNVNHSAGTIAIGSTSVTFTTNYVAHAYIISITQLTTGNTFNYSFANQFQLEAGTTATAYEPYVGGVPAPNPDYPQDVHVVTGEQTVKVYGKNMLKISDGSFVTQGLTFTRLDNTITVSGKYTGSNNYKSLLNSNGATVALERELSAGTYVLSMANAASKQLEISLYNSSDVRVNHFLISAGTTNTVFTLSETVTGIKLFINNLTTNEDINVSYPNLQIEAGTAPTDYEPYQSQTYTVDLGSTELCKLGDYQDFIYKSGDDWYVHKEIGKCTFTGSEGWGEQSNYNTDNRMLFGFNATNAISGDNIADRTGISNNFIFTPVQGSNIDVTGFYFHQLANYSKWIYVKIQRSLLPTENVAGFKNWLANNNMTVYYQMSPATDTQITDTTLIGQLDALAGAKSYLDATNFNVTATGTNLPALLKPEVYVKSLNGVLEYLSHI